MASDITGALLGEQGFGTNTTSLPLDTAFNFDLDPGAADGESSEDEAFIATQQAASNRKTSNLHGRAVKKGGGFQSMGLNANLLKAITRKGFSVPTPIQRKTIPLVLDSQDVVGMARTGSGKTAAFVIPLIQALKCHSAKVGLRAILFCPSRELALQTIKVVKELGRGTDLRACLLVGGDSLEDQFSDMTTNPDIAIATPGRFLHLKVEMGLDLSSVRFVVFDEADRLFEMGFASQLTEILHSLPASRQTLLFSATLPKTLVEFARAGLQEPKLVRLDAESKVSPDLQSAFFNVKSAEKEGALLHILQDVIKMPLGRPRGAETSHQGKKRKRNSQGASGHESPTEHSTIIFSATKHHVEYLNALLRTSGYAVSYVYGSLDQAARKLQIQNFRSGLTNILVVTDVAARGIDIPILSNVINYDFPAHPKIFVHRVGRTARAGKKGWSYNLVTDADTPYLLDLQLFLGRRLMTGKTFAESVSFAEDVVLGTLQRSRLESCMESVTKFLDEDDDLRALRTVASKGEKQYSRTRSAASTESVKRSKSILAAPETYHLSSLFHDDENQTELAREDMLARVSGFRPSETVFEIGKRGAGAGGEAAEIMKRRREKIDPIRNMDKSQIKTTTEARRANPDRDQDQDEMEFDMLESSDDEVDVTFPQADPESNQSGDHVDAWQDDENFMSYAPKSGELEVDRAYGVHSGAYKGRKDSSFVQDARDAVMNLDGDESKGMGEVSHARRLRWDKRSKKYVARENDEDGSKGTKLVRGESGQKIAASFRSGRFDAWRKTNKVDRLPRTGDLESASSTSQLPGRRFKHRAEQAPKEADRFRDNFYKQKKRVQEAKEKRIGKFKDGQGKSELKGVEAVRKDRKLKEKRRDKNARPSKKRKL